MNWLVRRVVPAFGLAVLLTSSAGRLQAAITGDLFFGGTARVYFDRLDYTPPVASGFGSIRIDADNQTGIFSVYNGDLTANGQIVDRTQPVGVPLNVNNYLRLPGPLADVEFILTFVRPGVFSSAQCNAPAANEQTCTLPPIDPDGPGPLPALVSPYNLTNRRSNSPTGFDATADFTVEGIVRRGAEVGRFTGIFNATIKNTTYQQLISRVQSGQFVAVNYSAQFTVTQQVIPEPSSLMLGFSGAALIALSQIRRLRRRG